MIDSLGGHHTHQRFAVQAGRTDEPVTPRAADSHKASRRRVRSDEAAAALDRVCSQAFRFKVGDDVVDQDGERCRVASVDTEDFEKPYELEYPNGSKFWAAESAIRRHKVLLSGRRWMRPVIDA
jgi:hypothetical protein